MSPAALEGRMADSWKSAKEEAGRNGWGFVCHDLERGTYEAERRQDDCGHFVCGRFVPHRAICMSADLSSEEMAAKEAAYLAEHPESAPAPAT